jgi:hypothetical protein
LIRAIVRPCQVCGARFSPVMPMVLGLRLARILAKP